MKALGTSILLLLAGITFSHESYSQDSTPVLQGPYVGQTPPGLTPKRFAPAVPSDDYRDWGGSFTPDMSQYYFGRRMLETGENKRFVFTATNNKWTLSEVDFHMGKSISPDGNTMFSGYRYLQRTADGWSELKSLGPAFEAFRIMRLTASSNDTYVFDEMSRSGDGQIRYSRLVDGKHEDPKPFGKQINAGKWTAHPFIAPDESYLMWDSEREGGFGSSDMYVSFRKPDGSWGEAINLGPEINTEGEDGGANVTPDGKYLFFCRRCKMPDLEIMWVDAQVIENLRPEY